MTEINRTTGNPMLDDVLDEYAAAGPSRAELDRWLREYPQFQRELTEFTIYWLELKHLRPVPATTDPAAAQARAASILGEVLHKLRTPDSTVVPEVDPKEAPASPAPPSFDSLIGQAKRQGMTIEQLARAVSMSVAMIMSLHRRLVVAPSVPRSALTDLGRALQLSADMVFDYLNSPPRLDLSQHFKSRQAPRIVTKIAFVDLVNSDPELAAADRAHWLSLVSSDANPPLT
jgi:hypothetical protein